ncbi:UNVERIFIED_CONTAM: hypothetical protein Slati_2454700 [Sesamum latifolium]|uniref:Reverse transcriptase domain-containing protein n=1 Tax=Sesamum latifolium TaxID=2727402 RepID=A0AAW2WDH5_9LAMI
MWRDGGCLWDALGRISPMVNNAPWLVGVDFNTVLDDSEVCGHSGDIRAAAEEFQGCLQDTGLITLPMQGEWFSWHNCSRDSRSLWKRLDRLLETKGAETLASTFLNSAQDLLAQDRQCPLLLHLEFCCKMILRLATRLEQNMLHQHAKIAWMKGGDQCSRIFFRKVAKRRSSKKNLLGGDRRDHVIDLCYLRPWARHILSEAEALSLVPPVTPGEIKHAVFDIDEVKAPGPDGYSSGFFKAAWPVVGEEVTRAILEFFRTGRLLKQVNITLISLIPKVATPTVVVEFRPISCCKTFSIRSSLRSLSRGCVGSWTSLSALLRMRLCQGSIGDNILLAQELFHGYNQQHLPPRCALKVDLRKAYDTVEWDF